MAMRKKHEINYMKTGPNMFFLTIVWEQGHATEKNKDMKEKNLIYV